MAEEGRRAHSLYCSPFPVLLKDECSPLASSAAMESGRPPPRRRRAVERGSSADEQHLAKHGVQQQLQFAEIFLTVRMDGSGGMAAQKLLRRTPLPRGRQ